MEEVVKAIQGLNFMATFIAVTAFLVGMKFPDYDFKLRLQHRSIVTHSPLVVFLFIYYHLKEPLEVTRYFIIGFSLAIGIHLIFDLFPKGWGGGALLKIPILRIKCTPFVTKNLFKIFIVTSLWISIMYTTRESEFLLILFLGVFVILKNIKKEKKLVRPLFVYILFFLVLGSFKYETIYLYVIENLQNGVQFIELLIR